MNEERLAELRAAMVSDRVKFAGERNAYTIQARSERFIVCTKPFALRKTVIYAIVDMVEMVRGPENLIFGFGAETREQCEEMLARLEHGAEYPETEIIVDGVEPAYERHKRAACYDEKNLCCGTEVSHRHRVPLDVDRVFYLGARA